MTAAAFRNALIVLQAIGGSTNGAGPSHRDRAAAPASRIDLDAFDALGREVPVLVDLKPSGEHYMEHFHQAGGVPRLMRELGDLLDLDAPTVTGATLARGRSTAPRRAGADRRSARASNPIKPDRRDGGAARQPRAARRGHQAVGGDARAAARIPAAPWCSTRSRT